MNSGAIFSGYWFGPDVVARPRDDDRQAVRLDEGDALHVAAGLARGVRAARVQRVVLFRPCGRRHLAVDLVGGDVQHALDASAGFGDGRQQAVGAVDVGLDERRRLQQRAVDVALGGEVDDGVDLVDQLPDELGVADVALHEAVALAQRPAFDVEQVVGVAGVGQLVEVDDLVVVVLRQEVADEVAADEARAARDEYLSHVRLARESAPG